MLSFEHPTHIGPWQVLSQIGSGTYSQVYKVRKTESSPVYALKQIDICRFEQKEQDYILTEIRILSSIKHPNIIDYIESFVDFETKTLCIITEYADYGDLFCCIKKFRDLNKKIGERDIWMIVFQILRGLKALHSNLIIHRDLKSANIFLFSDGSVKIGDMNVAVIVQGKGKMATTQTGTPYYSSPEVWDGVAYSFKSDLWSLGCLVYEMAAKKVPFDAEDAYKLMKKIQLGIYDPLPKFYSIEIDKLVTLLLNVDAEVRPTADGIMEMGFIKKIEKYLEDSYI